MRALAKLKPERGIWMTDVPEPAIGHNDLKIRIRKTAICAQCGATYVLGKRVRRVK